ncbi:hypothetical protein ACWFRF_15560 [Nocardia sp. NPDC055165]
MELLVDASVDAEGEAILSGIELHEYVTVERQPFHCTRCGTDFDNFEQALAHLPSGAKVQKESFPVISLTRDDIALALADDDDYRPEWPKEVYDDQVEALALKVQTILTSETDVYWEAVRAGVQEHGLEGRWSRESSAIKAYLSQSRSAENQ